MRADESRPAGAAPEAAEPGPILLADALDDSISWYQAGVEHGIAMGRQQLEDEWRGRMTVSAAIARQIASAGPFEVLCQRRGEPGRAQAQRELLRARGVIA